MINTALLKEQLKRFWGLPALLFAWYTLTIALPIYTSNVHCVWQTHSRLLTSLLNRENGFMVFSVLVAPLIAVIVLFKFQNQVKATTTVHSYPLTRNQLLATNALTAMFEIGLLRMDIDEGFVLGCLFE